MFSIILFTILFFYQIKFAVSSNCEIGWSEFNGSCFKAVFIEKLANFVESRMQCANIGGDLASIHSQQEDEFVQELVKAVNPKEIVNAYFMGLLLLRPPRYYVGCSDEILEAQWVDGTPVDYGNPTADGFVQGAGPWSSGFYLEGNPLLFAKKEPNNNDGCAMEHCVLTVAGPNNLSHGWADLACEFGWKGYVCRKPIQSTSDHSMGFQFRFLSFIGIFSQIYVFWLISKKSPIAMRDYTFFLRGNVIFDMAFLFAFGILLAPKLWLPHAYAATSFGLSKFVFGQFWGATISVCLAVFAGAGQTAFQLNSLFFRFASIMEREYPRFHEHFLQKATFFRIIFFDLLFSTAISLYTFYTLGTPEMDNEEIKGVIFYDAYSTKFYSDARLANQTMFFIVPTKLGTLVIVLSSILSLLQVASFFLAFKIIHYLKQNSKSFTERTYRLQLQLIYTLICQLLLPIIFIVLPVLSTIILKIYDQTPSQLSVDIGVEMLEINAFLNPLFTVIMVTPYRRYTLKICGFSKIKIFQGKGTATAKVEPKNEQQKNGAISNIENMEKFNARRVVAAGKTNKLEF